MSELAKQARAALKAKAQRLAGQTIGKVDASDYGPEENMHADVKTGVRPISRRAYKSGGSIEGDDAKRNAGRKPRAPGGKALADDIANTDQKDANEAREGLKKVGGMANGGTAGDMVPKDRFSFSPASGSRMTQAAGLKKGGRTAKSIGGDVALGLMSPAGLALKSLVGGNSEPTARKSGGGNWIKGAIKRPGALHEELGVPKDKKIPARKLENAEHSDNPTLAKRARLAETLGRMNRADGGRTGKGKMNVNIIIATGKPSDQTQGPPMGASPIRPPVPPMAPPPGPPQGLGAAAPPPMMQPPSPPLSAPPMMPRKSGGRTYREMHAGSGSGVGRLEKLGITKYDP